MDVGGGLARRGVVRPGGQERDHVVAGDGLQRGDRLRASAAAPPATGADGVGGHGAGLGVRGQHERLDLAPELVLVRLAPDVAHLGQGVALDHGFYPAPLPRRALAVRAVAAGGGRRSATSGRDEHGRDERQLGDQRRRRRPTGIVASASARPPGRAAGPARCRAASRTTTLPARNSAAPAGQHCGLPGLAAVPRRRAGGPRPRARPPQHARGQRDQAEQERDVAVEIGVQRQRGPAARCRRAVSTRSARSSSPPPKTIHHSAAATARPSTAAASSRQLDLPGRWPGSAAPIPTAATDSPIATMTRALCRSRVVARPQLEQAGRVHDQRRAELDGQRRDPQRVAGGRGRSGRCRAAARRS